MDYAQPERSRKSTFMLAESQKVESLFETFRCTKQETLLFEKGACSAYGPRTARILARKSTYMLAESQKVVSVFETLRCT